MVGERGFELPNSLVLNQVTTFIETCRNLQLPSDFAIESVAGCSLRAIESC